VDGESLGGGGGVTWFHRRRNEVLQGSKQTDGHKQGMIAWGRPPGTPSGFPLYDTTQCEQWGEDAHPHPLILNKKRKHNIIMVCI